MAARSGVSTATVARVLRNTGQVGPELTARVERAVAELGYVPNAVARSLTRGRTGLVGLVIPDIANPFFAELARGLEDSIVGAGYHVLVSSSGADPDREATLITSFAGRTVDAVVMMPMDRRPDRIQQLLSRDIPVVLAGGKLRGLTLPAVVSDGKGAAAHAVAHLFEHGHRDVAMITGPEGFRTVADGIAGFRAAYRATGRPAPAELVLQGHVGVQGGRDAMRLLLGRRRRPTACITLNDLLTVGALEVLREAGVSVPDEMSLISFDDMVLFPFTDPPITAIAQPAYRMGQAAGDMVLAAVDGVGRLPARPVVLRTQFRERGSCGAPPAGRRS